MKDIGTAGVSATDKVARSQKPGLSGPHRAAPSRGVMTLKEFFEMFPDPDFEKWLKAGADPSGLRLKAPGDLVEKIYCRGVPYGG